MIAFDALIIVAVLVCDVLLPLWRELGRPFFLEDIFGLNPLHTMKRTSPVKNKFIAFIEMIAE
jgi:hypothetical protein